MTYDVTPAGRKALEAFVAAGDELQCIHCGCTEHAACTIDVAQLAPAARAAVTYYFTEGGDQLPDRVPCWWISLDPPVCSNPHCAELHRAATVGVTP